MRLNHLILTLLILPTLTSFSQQELLSTTVVSNQELNSEGVLIQPEFAVVTMSTMNKAPMSCFINFMSITIGSCDPLNDYFSITGYIEFLDPPLTGDVVFTDCNGNSQSYSAPFTSPLAYEIDSIFSDGTNNCNVTVQFTADPACTMTSPSFNYPQQCSCFSDAGTFNQDLNGSPVSNAPILLCYGDTLNINSNGDYTPPNDFTSQIPMTTYDPGMWLLAYSCPPSIFPPDPLFWDSLCLLGVASTDNQAWSLINTTGDDSTYWFNPVTMYSMTDGTYAVSVNGGPWCYDLGPSYQVTYLKEITSSYTVNCLLNSIEATINGGLPSFDGSNFTASNLLPAYATFTNTTTGNGGAIGVEGLMPGDTWSFDVVDGNGCTKTISGQHSVDASFLYWSSEFCNNSGTFPLQIGTNYGTYSAPSELDINVTTGFLDLTNCIVGGPYTITYTIDTLGCYDQATWDMTIVAPPTVGFSGNEVCAGDSTILTGTGANTYSWSNGVSDGEPFWGDTSIMYIVYGHTGLCSSQPDTAWITIHDNPTPPIITIVGSTTICPGDSLILSSSASNGNLWSSWDTSQSITIDSPGQFFVTYTDTNGCSATSDTIPVILVNSPSITIAPIPDMCYYDPIYTLTEGSPAGGVYLGTGVVNDQFDPGLAGLGTHSIAYKYTDTNTCTSTVYATVFVDQCLSINETNSEDARVYPNPVENLLVIEFSGIFTFEIVDVRGRIVEKGKALNISSTNTENYEAGIYFVTIENDQIQTTVRVVKK
ncbi:MAG: T9SS type A sorting domain-containing protein [Crocinitomicaceae bacterium]|nr:T9SS type A sorting domain-containing protein [Crocinitomicaceae bacterium]